MAALIILSMLTAYVAAQLNAAGKAFQETFHWRYAAGVGAGAAIVLVYTLIGGFRAVAWTDVLQAALMIAGVVILPTCMIALMGGPGEFWRRLAELESQQIVVHGKSVTLAGERARASNTKVSNLYPSTLRSSPSGPTARISLRATCHGSRSPPRVNSSTKETPSSVPARRMVRWSR